MTNDLISRSVLLEALEYNPKKREIVQPRSTFGIILAAPAVDAVEVVRCGECIYRGSEAHIPGFAYCKLYKCAKDFDGYCDEGERGDNETDRR